MLLGRVVGSVTATRKDSALSGYTLLLIQPRVRPDASKSDGDLLVAVDTLGAGRGEDVIVATGRAARLALGKDDLPVDAAVVGIVDRTELS